MSLAGGGAGQEPASLVLGQRPPSRMPTRARRKPPQTPKLPPRPSPLPQPGPDHPGTIPGEHVPIMTVLPVPSPPPSSLAAVAPTTPSAGPSSQPPLGGHGVSSLVDGGGETTFPARPHTTGRRGLDLGGEHCEPAPGPIIIQISIFWNDLLGQTTDDQRRRWPIAAFAISSILKSNVSFCLQDAAKLRLAVQYLEMREPRLAVCYEFWGACALLCRSLGFRAQSSTNRRRQQKELVDPAAAGDALQRANMVAASSPSGEAPNQLAFFSTACGVECLE